MIRKIFNAHQIKSLIVNGKSHSILLWLGMCLFQIPILVWWGMEDWNRIWYPTLEKIKLVPVSHLPASTLCCKGEIFICAVCDQTVFVLLYLLIFFSKCSYFHKAEAQIMNAKYTKIFQFGALIDENEDPKYRLF